MTFKIYNENRSLAAESREAIKVWYKWPDKDGIIRKFDTFMRLHLTGDVQGTPAYPAQHYGFTSYMPRASGHAVVVPINGSTGTRVSVAEWMCGGPQDLAQGEVSLWSRDGQELRYAADGKMRAKVGTDGWGLPGNPNTTTAYWELAGDGMTVSRDLTVERDLVVGRDLTTQHLIGGGDVEHGVDYISAAPKIATASAVGDDISFDLTFSVASSQTLSAGDLIANVALARAYASNPRCVVSACSSTWPAVGVSFSAQAVAPGVVEVRYQGGPISGPATDLSCTVFVFGRS